MNLLERWVLIRISDLSFASCETFHNLIAPCYSESHRKYNNLSRLQRLFNVLDSTLPIHFLPFLNDITISIFFSSIYHTPVSLKNIEKNISIFRAVFPGISDSSRVPDFIKSMKLGTPDQDLGLYLKELDLSDYGSLPGPYDRLTGEYYSEFQDGDPLFFECRLSYLQNLIDSKPIFKTLTNFETNAIHNISREIERIRNCTFV